MAQDDPFYQPLNQPLNQPLTVRGDRSWSALAHRGTLALLEELCAIRQLLEKAEQRAERDEAQTRDWLNAYGRRATYERRDPAVEGQRAMMAGEK